MTEQPDPAGWLLGAVAPALRDTARRQWRNGQTVLMPLGTVFSAVRLPQELVLAHTGGQWDPVAAGEILTQVFDRGPVICDPCPPARWYALVPTPTSVCRTDTDVWRTAGVIVLGLGRHLNIPPLHVTAHDPSTGVPYWALPLTLPDNLCEPEHVDRLITTTPDRRARETQT